MDAMQQAALVACSKQHCGHAGNSFGAMQQTALVSMQQTALVPCSKQHWCHSASSIGAMQEAVLVTFMIVPSEGVQLGA
jgi:hypothetical protein